MSKKKATMTLKDFHGGSIPSDIPLPSAPGVTVKPPVRRSDQRLRPGSAGSIRNFDDRSPFLTNSAFIGRNFDEDERKPLESIPTPRRIIKDDIALALTAQVEPARPHTTPAPQSTGGSTHSHAPRFTESNPHMGPNSQNAWGLRKEVVADLTVPVAAMKLATASALDKVSSGRWHSKQLIHSTNVEVISHSMGDTTYNKSVELYEPVTSESSERPKLKLLPRSKPSVEPIVDSNKNDTVLKEKGIETRDAGNNPVKHGVDAANGGNQAVVERPKLNLKPRSQPPEQLDEKIETERNALFGGARPREFVLKERGIDDVAANIQNQSQPPNRSETLAVNATTKARNIPLDHRISKNTDKRDQWANLEKTEVLHRNWRSENHGKSTRDFDKLQQQTQERPPSPDTWRKPIGQPLASLVASANPRYGKAASAVELAQAFSKSVSDSKPPERFPGRGNIPFSRLTGPLPRPQINGY